MKVLISAFLVSMGSSALACPNLSGSYWCPGDVANGYPPAVKFTLNQKIKRGVTVYSVTDPDETYALIGDGKLRKFTKLVKNHKVVSDTTVTCLGGALKIESFDVYTNRKDKKIAKTVDWLNYLSITSNGHLRWQGREITTVGEKVFNLQFNYACEKI